MMHTKWRRSGFAVALMLLATARSTDAQGIRDAFSPGIAGGFSKNANAIGYYGLATLEFALPMESLSLRADGLFADWGAGKVGALTANVLVSPFRGRRVSPYAIAGAGAYAHNVTGSLGTGWTLGLGLRLPGKSQSLFLESRLHTFVGQRRELAPPYSGQGWRAMWTPLGIGIQF